MAAKKKSVRKSESAVQPMQPGKNGGMLRKGSLPGNTPGTGRPPNWLRDWCDELLARPESKQQVEAILKDKDHSAFTQMWRSVADRAAGKPTEKVQVSGAIRHGVVILPSADRA